MTQIYTASNARSKIFELIDYISESHEPVFITSKRNNAVLVAESDWRSIQETLYLLSIPDMQQSIQDGLAEPLSNCSTEIKW